MYFCTKFRGSHCVSYTCRTYRCVLTTFQGLDSHMWLVASDSHAARAVGTAPSFQGEKTTRWDAPRHGEFGGLGEGPRDSFLDTSWSGPACFASWHVEDNLARGMVLSSDSQTCTSRIPGYMASSRVSPNR